MASKPPAFANVDQHAKAARARDVVGIARDREELVERCVADGELGGENAMHPGCRAERRLIRQHRVPRAQDRAMAARRDALLVAQDDVAVMRRIGREEGQNSAARPLLKRRSRVALGDLLLGQKSRRFGGQARICTRLRTRRGERDRGRAAHRATPRRRCGRDRRRSKRLRLIRHHKGRRSASAALSPGASRMGADWIATRPSHAAAARSASPRRKRKRKASLLAKCRPEQLLAVGGEAAGAVEAAMHRRRDGGRPAPDFAGS